MRTAIPIATSAAVLALAAAAWAAEAPKTPAPQAGASGPAKSGPQARAAGRYGAPTTYRTPALGKGYSAQSRHMADCLATYPGYDPTRDVVVVRPGVTRRCDL